VYNEGTLAINNCTLARNTASYGGTIFNLGALTLTNCSVADNYSWQVAGGIWNGGTLDIIGGTFTNNYTEGNGGGIGNRLGFVTIDGTLFANNYGRSSGGAIDHYDYFSTSDGTLDVANCTFRDNYGGTGGAIWSKDPTTIANSTFTGNTAGLAGGAIAHRGGPLTIATSVLTNNQSARYGGAIDVTNYGGANAVIRQSLFAGNSTDREGGAIENYLGTLELVNSTISGNSSNREGGGIWNWGTLKLTNATISGNRADSLGTWTGDGGGGLFNYGGTPVLNNTILAGNKRGPAVAEVQDDVFGSVDSASSHNFIGDAASAGGLTHGANGNIVGVNVALILDTNLANNGGPTLTHALLPGSIAVDAGLNALASGATDQRGAPRILDGNGDAVETVDIGAFELVTPAGLIQHVKNQVEQLGDSGLLTHGQQTSLLMLLENALANLRRDNTAAATQLLRTFLERVQHLVDAGALAPGAAEELTAPVLYLLGILGG
jgi:hypothetical protein